jgi:hypothetical protein
VSVSDAGKKKAFDEVHKYLLLMGDYIEIISQNKHISNYYMI